METFTGSNFVAFLAVALLLCVTPGPDMAIVAQHAVLHGRRAALASALGIEVGLSIWATAAIAGLAAVLQTSEMLFAAVRLAGAAYLIWLGVQSLLQLRRSADPAVPERSFPMGSPFRQGMLTNLSNPKIAVFFTSLIPQFVDAGPHVATQTAALSSIFIFMGAVWLTAFAVFASSVRRFIARPRVRKGVSGLTGIVLIGLGARLAIDRS